MGWRLEAGSRLSLVGTSTLPGIDGPSPQDLKPTDLRITAVTGERARVVGKRSLQITVSTCTVDHKFCLANIQDPCIIGPNVLTKWEATVDVPRATLYLGTKAVELHTTEEVWQLVPTSKASIGEPEV